MHFQWFLKIAFFDEGFIFNHMNYKRKPDGQHEFNQEQCKKKLGSSNQTNTIKIKRLNRLKRFQALYLF